MGVRAFFRPRGFIRHFTLHFSHLHIFLVLNFLQLRLPLIRRRYHKAVRLKTR